MFAGSSKHEWYILASWGCVGIFYEWIGVGGVNEGILWVDGGGISWAWVEFFFWWGGGVWVVTHFSITPLKSIEKLFVVDFDYGDNGSFAFHRFHCYSY